MEERRTQVVNASREELLAAAVLITALAIVWGGILTLAVTLLARALGG